MRCRRRTTTSSARERRFVTDARVPDRERRRRRQGHAARDHRRRQRGGRRHGLQVARRNGAGRHPQLVNGTIVPAWYGPPGTEVNVAFGRIFDFN
jgi:hypothetical protein